MANLSPQAKKKKKRGLRPSSEMLGTGGARQAAEALKSRKQRLLDAEKKALGL